MAKLVPAWRNPDHPMRLKLSLCLAANPRTRPILEGRVGVDGVDLFTNIAPTSEMFWRQLKFADWDISEMSFSSLMIAIARGDDRFVGLPVFTTRRFFHSHILVRKDAGIATPADLKGRRVGVTEYQQTAALWVRGALQHEFGVSPEDMEFFMERTPDLSHGGATGFKPPPGISFHQIPPEKNIGAMMIAGELDAALHYRGEPTIINRSGARLREHPAITHLFPDPTAEGVRYFRKTGLYPINHGMCVRREILEQHPWVAINIVKAFQRAAELADEQRMEHVSYHAETGLIGAEAMAGLATPVVRHGIVANRETLETAALYSFEQGLTPRLVKLEDVFWPSTIAV